MKGWELRGAPMSLVGLFGPFRMGLASGVPPPSAPLASLPSVLLVGDWSGWTTVRYWGEPCEQQGHRMMPDL